MNSAESLVLKFDLTQSSVQSDSHLLRVFKDESAVRACVLGETEGVFSTQGSSLESSDENYSALIIPGVEGTEIWIVPASKKEKFEKTLGFSRPSDVAVSLTFDKIKTWKLKDPFGRGEFLPNWSAGKSEWGIRLCALETMALNETDVKVLRDQGTFAFPSHMGGN